MQRSRDDSSMNPAVDFLPDDLDESTVHDLEFTIPIKPGNESSTSSAPLLDALTTYREDEHK